MTTELSLKKIQKKWHGTLKSYVIGFIASVLLTIASFSLVYARVLAGQPLVFAVIILALAQAAVQLLYFLHLGQEEKPRWELVVFGFMALLLLIIVIGSLWIMYNLNDRLMIDMTTGISHD